MPAEIPRIMGLPRRLPPPGRVLEILKQRFAGARTASPRPFEGEVMHYQRGRFAIVGDLQSTSRMEFWRKSNAQERVQLIQQIATEAPDFLAIVGALVFRGSSAAHWAGFDQLAAPLYQARVPILPLLGNHDYGMRRRPALAHFFRRFPHLGGRHWFSRIYGPLGLTFLDSNMGRLPAAQWREQIGWYRHELQRFEQMPELLGVLVPDLLRLYTLPTWVWRRRRRGAAGAGITGGVRGTHCLAPARASCAACLPRPQARPYASRCGYRPAAAPAPTHHGRALSAGTALPHPQSAQRTHRRAAGRSPTCAPASDPPTLRRF